VNNKAPNEILNQEHDHLRESKRVILTDLDGLPYVASGGGSTGGDASAANQVLIISELQKTNSNLTKTSQVIFNEIDVGIAQNLAVVSYLVPVGNEFILNQITCSGNGDGRFSVDIGGIVSVKRINITDNNLDFYFNTGLKIPAGSTINVFVRNDSTSAVRHFEVSVFGELNLL